MNVFMGYNPTVAKQVKVSVWVKEIDGAEPILPATPKDGDCFIVFDTSLILENYHILVGISAIKYHTVRASSVIFSPNHKVTPIFSRSSSPRRVPSTV